MTKPPETNDPIEPTPIEQTPIEPTMIEPAPIAPAKRAGDDGAGCFPAVLAATLLMGIVMFVMFGFAGYIIFQKRGDLAIRTLRGTMVVELEQSRLAPEDKAAVIGRLKKLADDIESGQYENWQAGGAMNRLIRAPLLRWGDLVAVNAWATTDGNLTPEQSADVHKQITRFFRAAELDRALATDLQDILLPVTGSDPAMMLGTLKDTLTTADVLEVGGRAKNVAMRAQIPDQTFDDVSLPEVVDQWIDTGLADGST